MEQSESPPLVPIRGCRAKRLDIHCSRGNLSDDNGSPGLCDPVNRARQKFILLHNSRLHKDVRIPDVSAPRSIERNLPVEGLGLQLESTRSRGAGRYKKASGTSGLNHPSIAVLR